MPSAKGPNHFKIALSEYYKEFSHNFRLVSASDTNSNYYHQEEPETNTWSYIFETEEWIWAGGGLNTVTSNSEFHLHVNSHNLRSVMFSLFQ